MVDQNRGSTTVAPSFGLLLQVASCVYLAGLGAELVCPSFPLLLKVPPHKYHQSEVSRSAFLALSALKVDGVPGN